MIDYVHDFHLAESEVWKNFSEQSNGFTLSYEMMRYYDWLCAWFCGFTVSSMTGAGLWILISIHESSESRVECLSMWVGRNLTEIMRMINVIDTWWLCANYENLINYVFLKSNLY